VIALKRRSSCAGLAMSLGISAGIAPSDPLLKHLLMQVTMVKPSLNVAVTGRRKAPRLMKELKLMRLL
jgi:hypothetical protein